MPGNQGTPPGQDKEAYRAQRRAVIKAQAVARGHFNHGDIQDLRRDHSDDEISDLLAGHFATPEGQLEMAKAGRGGADPRELARLVMGGR